MLARGSGEMWGLVVGTRGNFFLDFGDKGIQGHSAQINAFAAAHRDGAVFQLFVADNQHIRDLLKLGFADFVADFLTAAV